MTTTTENPPSWRIRYPPREIYNYRLQLLLALCKSWDFNAMITWTLWVTYWGFMESF